MGRLRDRRRGMDQVSVTGDPDELLTPVSLTSAASTPKPYL
ncbi:hypothetical protein STAFG_8561 [Streptomyces afghaniensis 772]|uniref:Uncharacterized protein n=1 Tax=Streptomyces afghaniensis 772 TaxID=1283301 RepID=S4MFR2_9ACTN|nr:hypothetical protein STAFG_8561 [Streptomyces afghaniensis 772]